MPQQTINLPRDTTMQSIVTQLQAIASALNLDWSTIANKPSNISFHGTAATPGASVSPVGNNTPIKPCQDANGDRFSPEVFEESMYNNDGTPMHPAPGKMIAKEYDSTETYPTYSPYCINDNKFYKFSGSSTTTGSFDPSEWTEIDAAEEFTTLNSTLTRFSTVNNLTSEHSSVTISGGYISIGKLVIISAKLVASASIAVSTKIFSGAPNPLNSEGISYQLSALNFTGSVRQSGTNVYLNQAINADTYWVSGCYIAN